MGSIGFVAGLCTSGAMLPQLVHMIRSRSARDISWVMLLMSSIGQGFWIAHGVVGRDAAVITFATFNLLVNAATTVIKASTTPEQDATSLARLIRIRCLSSS